MKNSILAFIIFLVSLIIFGACEKKEQGKSDVVMTQQGLISQGFKSYNTYLIVCAGYPKEDAQGATRTSSAKMAAVLSAQFFAQQVFTSDVDVVKQGKVVKFEYKDDYVIVYYQVSKPGLKRYMKTEPVE